VNLMIHTQLLALHSWDTYQCNHHPHIHFALCSHSLPHPNL
jgi:hypothetical protein